MINHEVGHGHENAGSQVAECAACRVETQMALGELDQELASTATVPALVLDYISETYPDEEQSLTIDKVIALQAANPLIFSLETEQLITLLPTLLGRPQITNLTNENTQLDVQIKAERSKHTALRDTIRLEEITSTDPELKDLRGRELLDALKSNSLVTAHPSLQARLAEIEAKLDAFISVAADPEEALVLESIITQSAFDFGADSSAEMFSDLLVRTDTAAGLSEATKVKAHELFGLPVLKTAGDLQTVLNNGYGVDAAGNTLPITQDQKLRVFPHTYLYEEPSGDRLFEITVPGNRQYKIRFDRQTSEADLYDSSLTVQIMGLMAQMNLAGAIWQRGWTLQTGGAIDLHYDDVIKAKRIHNLMSGGEAGFDGKLISAGDQSSLLHRLQAFPSKGDAALNDNDPAQALSDYQELTIVDEAGAINWTQFEKAARYTQDVAARGGKPDFDDLKAHLTEVT